MNKSLTLRGQDVPNRLVLILGPDSASRVSMQKGCLPQMNRHTASLFAPLGLPVERSEVGKRVSPTYTYS